MVTPQRRENSPICNLSCFINALFSKTVQRYCFLVRCARFPKGRVCIFWKNCTKLHTPWRVIPNRSLDLSKKVLFIKIAFSFPSLILCLIPPTDDREKTERRAKRYRALAAKNSALFLRWVLKRLTWFPKKLSSFLKQLVFKHSFGKGSVFLRQKRILKTRNIKATESPPKSHRSPMVVA